MISDNSEISFNEVDPSNYEVTENDGVYRIKLYSKNYNNTRIFKFVYTLPEAVKVYDDVAQLNRKMVGQDWQQGISTVKVTIELPVSMVHVQRLKLLSCHNHLILEAL